MSDALLSLGEDSVELGEKRLQLVFRASTGAVQATYPLADAHAIDSLLWLLEVAKQVESNRKGEARDAGA